MTLNQNPEKWTRVKDYRDTRKSELGSLFDKSLNSNEPGFSESLKNMELTTSEFEATVTNMQPARRHGILHLRKGLSVNQNREPRKKSTNIHQTGKIGRNNKIYQTLK